MAIIAIMSQHCKGGNRMKRTIANTNKYFSSAAKKRTMIINSVHSSAKVEGSKTTKKELKEHYKLIQIHA